MQPLLVGIQKLLKKKLNINTTLVDPQTDLKRDLQLADWEMLYLLNAVESKWRVSIAQNEQEQIGNVAQLLAVLEKGAAPRREALKQRQIPLSAN